MSRLSPGLRRALETLAWTAIFALAYAQSPLYTSNQNQYFLHGLARAGVGFLRHDWLAGTAEPTPLFTALVQIVATTVGPSAFYLLYAGLMGVYLFSLADIGRSVFDLSPSGRRALLALLVVVHSAGLRHALARLLAPEAEYLLEGGLAGQRLLGAVLQPSVFGVFLVTSLAFFLRGHRVYAALALALAATIHPTYLLGAGLLLAIYVGIDLARPDTRRHAPTMGLIGAAALAPVAVWAFVTFRPPGADLYARAADILIRLRIPHHTIPIKWLDFTVALQALLVAGALVVARRSRLFWVLLVGTLAVAALTAAQMATANPTLALAFPWRLSTVLIPVSTACLAAAGASAIAGRRAAGVVLGLAVALAVAAGVVRFDLERRAQRDDPAAPMMDFVAARLREGQVYFIPPKLQDFRLRTGAPIVVEAKAIPYRAEDVTAWFDRLSLARAFFRDRAEWIDCAVLGAAAREYGATHVVLGPEQLGLECEALEELYRDEGYAVYRITLPP